MDIFSYLAPVAFVFALGAYSQAASAMRRLERIESELAEMREYSSETRENSKDK
ncbi:MAG: hypothetical protein R6U92_05730 [Bacillota bacterium]